MFAGAGEGSAGMIDPETVDLARNGLRRAELKVQIAELRVRMKHEQYRIDIDSWTKLENHTMLFIACEELYLELSSTYDDGIRMPRFAESVTGLTGAITGRLLTAGRG